jgi:hypothetical protein
MRSMEGPKRKRISRVNTWVLMIDQVKPAILEGTAVPFDRTPRQILPPRNRASAAKVPKDGRYRTTEC